MKILSIGQLGTAIAGSGVTGLTFGSGTSTPPIDLTGISSADRIGVWLSVEGDFGKSGCSVAVIWKGSYNRSGATYTAFLRGDQSGVTGNYLIKSSRTTGGFFANGSFLKVIRPCMPWIRLEAIQKRAGTTNAGIIKYAVCVL
jgi:hypothetical protein